MNIISGPYPFEPIYRNMLVPGPPFNASPYHLSMAARIPTPEDLSRNPNTKALDLLQHHANQYYNTHKIHELSERALKSPTSNTKVNVSSPSTMQPSGPSNPMPDRGGSVPPGMSAGPPGLPPGSSLGGSNPLGVPPKNLDKPLGEVATGREGLPSSDIKDGPGGRSPPPQRHVHTHHHTHVGLGYPIGAYAAPYGGKYGH